MFIGQDESGIVYENTGPAADFPAYRPAGRSAEHAKRIPAKDANIPTCDDAHHRVGSGFGDCLHALLDIRETRDDRGRTHIFPRDRYIRRDTGQASRRTGKLREYPVGGHTGKCGGDEGKKKNENEMKF